MKIQLMRSTGSRPAEDVNAGNATHASACRLLPPRRHRQVPHELPEPRIAARRHVKICPFAQVRDGSPRPNPGSLQVGSTGTREARRTAICADGTWPASDRGAARVASIERAAHGHRVESDPQEGRVRESLRGGLGNAGAIPSDSASDRLLLAPAGCYPHAPAIRMRQAAILTRHATFYL